MKVFPLHCSSFSQESLGLLLRASNADIYLEAESKLRRNGTTIPEIPLGFGFSANCKFSFVSAGVKDSHTTLTHCSSNIMSLSPQVLSSGVFELKIHSFHTAQRICRRHRDCHIFFRICLKHPEDVISAEPPCTFGTGQTNVIRADHTSISSSDPIRVPFHFKWPVSGNTSSA